MSHVVKIAVKHSDCAHRAESAQLNKLTKNRIPQFFPALDSFPLLFQKVAQLCRN